MAVIAGAASIEPITAMEPGMVAPRVGAAELATPGMTSTKMPASAKAAAAPVSSAAVATAVLCQRETGRY
jgi:hypothetical protein